MDLFPFSKIRQGQDELISSVRLSVENKKHLIAHAPTGMGKTISTIVPALEYALQNSKTVVFLTPKHTQHQIVIETLQKIKEKTGTNIISVDFIGKRWMCSVPGIQALTSSDFSEYCKEMKAEERCAFYNNVKKKAKLTDKAKSVIDELKKQLPMHVEEVCSFCSRREMCPYEISCELAKDARFVIADYFHIFSPWVRKAFLTKINKEISDLIIIVDEAQNLPSRIREVLSTKISNFSIKAAISEARRAEEIELSNQLSILDEIIFELGSKLKDEKEAHITREDLMGEIKKQIGDYDGFAADLLLVGDRIRSENKKSFVGSIGKFLEVWPEDSDAHIRLIKKDKYKDKDKLEILFNCLDPAFSSRELFQESHTSILMSGTLTPTRMYRDVLGFEPERTRCVEYDNPFPTSNRLAMIIPDTTTKYTRRSEDEFQKIADWCARVSNQIPGNVAVFFPSYWLRDQVLKHFQRKSSKSIFTEKQGMNKGERMDLLDQFKEYSMTGAVFLGATSGSFAEGVDLPGNFLNGVIIVGIPLDSPDLETKAIIEYYDKIFGAGWNYGYLYPAMNRTVQAAGRVIRSELDKGVVVFLDERFTWKNYFRCLPLDWRLIVTLEPERRIKNFYENGN
ncbi:MAG TPA: ATP-dependent DNA helicase [Candidatus Woesearchaeota archaeon]|nr:ATP-dependent DNA helicase [Candidatus Woesearchaeota archaeon]